MPADGTSRYRGGMRVSSVRPDSPAGRQGIRDRRRPGRHARLGDDFDGQCRVRPEPRRLRGFPAAEVLHPPRRRDAVRLHASHAREPWSKRSRKTEPQLTASIRIKAWKRIPLVVARPASRHPRLRCFGPATMPPSCELAQDRPLRGHQRHAERRRGFRLGSVRRAARRPQIAGGQPERPGGDGGAARWRRSSP